MPWRCPACGSQISHHESEERPRSDNVYRCHVCRLELVLDQQIAHLVIAPIRVDEPDQKIRRTS